MDYGNFGDWRRQKNNQSQNSFYPKRAKTMLEDKGKNSNHLQINRIKGNIYLTKSRIICYKKNRNHCFFRFSWGGISAVFFRLCLNKSPFLLLKAGGRIRSEKYS